MLNDMALKVFLFIIALTVSSAFAQPNVRLEITESYLFNGADEKRSAIIGTVKNTGTVRLHFIRIEALAFDGDGNQVAEDFTYSKRGTLLPGEASPFRILFDEGTSPSSYTLSLSADPKLFLPGRDIDIIDSYLNIYDDLSPEIAAKLPIFIGGTLINRGDQPVEYAEINVAGYNEAGQIIALGFGLERDVMPGERREFRAIFYPYTDEPIVSHETWAEQQIFTIQDLF